MSTSPETIGRYQVQEQVGAGSNGMVYRCFDPILKRDVAVKVPAAGLSGDELQFVVENFYHEAEIGAQFQHANIVTVYDVGDNLPHSDKQPDSGRNHYLVMELADGMSLKDYLQQHGRLPVEETLRIIFECCKALDYIHYQGILHRDIKPSNIIYDADPMSVKITDFSISAYADKPSEKLPGTLPFSTPEHFLVDEMLTRQTDIFALGSVMYQMLTGSCPFQGDSVDEVASRIVSSNPRPIREYDHNIPAQVEFIVLKAMSKLPRDRFKNAVEFTDAVSFALKTVGSVKRGYDDKHRKNNEIDEYLILRNNSWFSEFSPDQIDELVRSGCVLNYEAGEYIVKEGDSADSFYTLLEGQAEVVKADKTINVLKPGACFGELGHLTKTHRRTASIRGATPVRVLVVETEKLLGMSPESQAEFYRAFLTITMERLIEKNEQFLEIDT